jgi:hypothetical protein
MQDNKDANVNIVVVDWGRLAGKPDPGFTLYHKAVHNTEIVGRRVGEMVDNLKKYEITVLSDVHLIGQVMFLYSIKLTFPYSLILVSWSSCSRLGRSNGSRA